MKWVYILSNATLQDCIGACSFDLELTKSRKEKKEKIVKITASFLQFTNVFQCKCQSINQSINQFINQSINMLEFETVLAWLSQNDLRLPRQVDVKKEAGAFWWTPAK